MSDIAKLGFVVDSADLKRAERDLDGLGDAADKTERKVNRASAGISGAASKIQQSLGNAATRSGAAWQRFRNEMSGMGGVAAGIGTAGISIHVSRAIEAAKNAQEANSMFNEVFKDQADMTRDWSNKLAREIGRSAYELQGQAAQFQQVLTGMFPDRKDAAEKARIFAGLAQDVASFYNLSEQEALSKLRAGLTGEMEGLKSLGLVISAASVEAKALEMGLAATKKELTDQDKAAARAQLIIEGLADAQGDAARTADGLANQQRALSSAVNDLYITLGTALLPVATQIVSKLRDLVGAFSSLSPETQKYIAYAAGLAAALGPLLIGFGLLSTALGPLAAAFGLLVSPIGLVIGAMAGIAYVIADWDRAKAVMAGLAADLGPKALAAVQAIDGQIKTLAEKARGAIAGMASAMGQKMGELAQSALTWASEVVAQVVAGLGGMYDAGVAAIQQLWDGMKAKMAELKAWLSAELASAVSIRPDSPLGRLTGAGRVSSKDGNEQGKALAEGITNGLYTSQGLPMSASEAMMKGVLGASRDAAGIQSPSTVMIEYGKYLSQGLGLGIAANANMPVAAMNDMVDKTADVGSSLKSAFQDIFRAGIQDWSNFGDAIKNAFLSKMQEMASGLLDVGLDGIFGSLFGGVQGSDMLSNALRAIPGLATGGTVRKGGWAMVGERGPELVNLPGGSTVYDAKQTRSATSGQQNTHVTVGVDPRTGNLTAFVDRRADAIAGAHVARSDAKYPARWAEMRNQSAERF